MSSWTKRCAHAYDIQSSELFSLVRTLQKTNKGAFVCAMENAIGKTYTFTCQAALDNFGVSGIFIFATKARNALDRGSNFVLFLRTNSAYAIPCRRWNQWITYEIVIIS